MNRTTLPLLTTITLLLTLTACAPEVGSDSWCEDMADKAKGDWTVNEATEFATNCIVKNYD
jgi:hypothetical protein